MESEAGPAGSGSRGLTLLDYAWVIWRYKILAIAVIAAALLVGALLHDADETLGAFLERILTT